MPELPEVETIRRGLQKRIVHKRIAQCINYASKKSFPNQAEQVTAFMIGAEVVAVHRRAKLLLVELSSLYTVMIHLKMTGQLVYVDVAEHWGGGHPSDSLIHELPDTTTRETLVFTDGSQLFFNDLRKFGWMKLCPTAELPAVSFLQTVGPEPLDPTTVPGMVIPRIRRHNKTTIKAAILNQSVIAGVGNIYADESLWMARIHPATRVENVTDEQIINWLSCVKQVMKLSIEQGGSTDKNYIDVDGKRGNYLAFAHVFRREGLPCSRHPGVLIEKIRVAGRGTHICPVCQVLVP